MSGAKTRSVLSAWCTSHRAVTRVRTGKCEKIRDAAARQPSLYRDRARQKFTQENVARWKFSTTVLKKIWNFWIIRDAAKVILAMKKILQRSLNICLEMEG